MTTVAVIGLGTMGLGIAQIYAAAGCTVLGFDAHPPARDSAAERLGRGLAARVAAGKMPAEARDGLLSRFEVVDALPALAGADLAIEAVVERLEVKQTIFAALEAVLAPGAVLATNTSSLSVAAMAQRLSHPERVLGLHFFNPAPVMKLVELVAHSGTSPAALVRARQITEGAGKVVVACPDRPGFIVNRCARPFYGEALAMVEEGRSPGEVDAALVAAGYPLGPFGLIDLVGADINLAATQSLHAAMVGSPRYHVFAALMAQVARGDLGRKSGRGFVFPDGAAPAPMDAAALALRIEAVMINEAAWLVSEGGTSREGIDMALKLGLNFPRGPFEMLRAYGAAQIHEVLGGLEAQAPEFLKGRYLPAPGL